eukprot:4315115-Prymnesium_polylepis.1
MVPVSFAESRPSSSVKARCGLSLPMATRIANATGRSPSSGSFFFGKSRPSTFLQSAVKPSMSARASSDGRLEK